LHPFYKKFGVAARFGLMFKLLNVKKAINCKVRDIYIYTLQGMEAKYFSFTFLLFLRLKKNQN